MPIPQNYKSKITALDDVVAGYENIIKFNSRDKTVIHCDRDEIRSVIRGLLNLGIIKMGNFRKFISCAESAVASFLGNRGLGEGHESDIWLYSRTLWCDAANG